MKAIILVFVFILISACSQQVQKTSAKISFSTKQFVTGSADELVLYAINKNKNEQRTVILSDFSVNLDLDFGNWEFVVLGWEGNNAINSSLICGRTLKTFNKVTDSLSIQVNALNCNDPFFAGEQYRNSFGIKSLNLVSCLNVPSSNLISGNNTVISSTNCDWQERGFAGSYKVSLLGHGPILKSQLPSLDLANSPKLSSACISAVSPPESITSTGLKLPFGSADFTPPLMIEVFYGPSCEGELKSFLFPNGLGSSNRPSKSAVLSSSLTNDVFLEMTQVFLAGELNFGQRVYGDSYSTTLTLVNSTSDDISNLSIALKSDPNNQSAFSISHNTCTSSLSKKTSCELKITFSPANQGSFEQLLKIQYSLNGFVKYFEPGLKGLGVPDTAPVAEFKDAVTIIENQINEVYFYYSDQENNQATSCDLKDLDGLFIRESCSCPAGKDYCVVGLDSSTNSSGKTTFKFTITANGLVSDEVEAEVTISAQDDAPVGITTSFTSVNEAQNHTVWLSYLDEENDLATECSVSDLSGIELIKDCSCDQAGQCMVEFKGLPAYHGYASFKYYVVANGLSSESKQVTYSIDNVEFPPVLNGISPNVIDEDTKTFLALDFSDEDGDIGTECSVVVPNSLTLTDACDCDENGCSVGVKGAPNYSGSSEIIVSVTTGENDSSKSSSAKYSLSVSAVDDAPVVVDNTITMNEDSVASFTIPYTDAENHLATSCSVDNSDKIVFTQACTCTNGVCSLKFTTQKNYNGEGSFNFNVKANNLISNTATLTVNINAIDDAPVVSNISTLLSFPQTINLKYSDAENNLAEACAISEVAGLTSTPTCTCSSGSCSAYVTNAIMMNEISGFSYQIVTNGKTSGLAHVNFNPGYPNYFQSIPIKQSLTGYNGLPGNHINDVFVDVSSQIEKLYVATGKGLGISTDGGVTYSIKTVKHGLGSNLVNAVTVSNSKIYASTSNGLSISSDGGQSFTNIVGSGLGSNYINHVTVYNGVIYASTSYGLGISSENDQTFTNRLFPSNYNIAYNTYVDDTGIYIGTTNGISFSADLSGSGNFTLLKILENGNAIYRATRNNGILYAAGTTGFYAYNNSIFNPISNDFVYKLFVKDDNIYLTTNNGFAKYDGSVLTNFTHTNGGFSTSMSYENGKIYLGTSNGLGVSTNSGSTFNFIKNLAYPIPYYSIKDIVVGDGLIYTASSSGIGLSIDNGKSFTPILPDNGTSLALEKGVIYIGTYNGLKISYDNGQSFNLRNISHGLPSNTVNDIHVAANGFVYVATESGWAYSKDNGQTFVAKTSGIPPSIKGIHADSDGNVFLATSYGLYITSDHGEIYSLKTTSHGLAYNGFAYNLKNVFKYNNMLVVGSSFGISISFDNGSSFKSKNITHGLPSNEINDVKVKNNIILVSTPKGFAYSTDLGNSFQTQNIGDGLGSLAINGSYMDDNGIIYVSTDTGIYTSIANVFLTWRNSNDVHISNFDFGQIGNPSVISNRIFIKNTGNTTASGVLASKLQTGTASFSYINTGFNMNYNQLSPGQIEPVNLSFSSSASTPQSLNDIRAVLNYNSYRGNNFSSLPVGVLNFMGTIGN